MFILHLQKPVQKGACTSLSQKQNPKSSPVTSSNTVGFLKQKFKTTNTLNIICEGCKILFPVKKKKSVKTERNPDKNKEEKEKGNQPRGKKKFSPPKSLGPYLKNINPRQKICQNQKKRKEIGPVKIKK